MVTEIIDDIYLVDDIGDVVIESRAGWNNSGYDTVNASVSFTLGSLVEKLVLTGANAIDGAGNDGANLLDGSQNLAANVLSGGAGDDVYILGAGDTIIEQAGGGLDLVQSSMSIASLAVNVEDIALTGMVAIDANGNAQANTINGNTAANVLYGDAGDDRLIGNAGNDVLIGGDGNDTYVFDNIGHGQDQIDNSANDNATAIDTIEFGWGIIAANVVLSRAIDDLVVKVGVADSITVKNYFASASNAKIDQIKFANGSIWAQAEIESRAFAAQPSAGADTISGTNDNDTIHGLGGNDTISGGAGDDQLFGDADDDTLNGDAGNDMLDGGSGNDRLLGGSGNDMYVVDSSGDLVTENAAEGTDTVQSGITYTLTANVENLTLTGTNAINGSGNALDNILTGNSANNILDGGAGIDLMSGGAGDDTYIVDNIGDRTIETAGGGVDTVKASVTWSLSGNIENIQLTGNAAINASGNELDNVITGNSANNSLTGGRGNDVYIFNRGDGQDTIDNKDLLTASDTLRFATGIVDTDLLAFKSGDHLFFKLKNSTDQVAIYNYYAANTTIGGQAADYKIDKVEFSNAVSWNQSMIQTMVDRATNNHAPTIGTALPNLNAKAGSLFSMTVPVNTIVDADVGDTVSYKLEMNDGSPLPVWLTFNAATRVISGTPSATNVGSFLLTLWGTDNYGMAQGQVVTMTVGVANRAPTLAVALADQAAGQGIAFAYTVPSNSFTDPDAGDTLTYSATLADGSVLPSWLTFNAATRAFSGTPSTLSTTSIKVIAKDSGNLIVSDVFDVVVSVQNRILTGTAGADTLTGGIGNDTLSGLAGNDTLIGVAGDDLLDGGTGSDSMSGGLGNDTYVVDAIGDIVTENPSEGTDTVKSAISYALGANVENLILNGSLALNASGNILANILTGNSGNNILDGAAGIDTMIGGAGNDTYIVDNISDVVSENLNEGTDLIQSSVTYTLSNNVENLTLTNTTAINGTGNAFDNMLIGNSAINTLIGAAGNDTLDGGAGADKLTGGTGDDTYIVDNIGDVIIENASEGMDKVQSSITYTLTSNVEVLTLAGTNTINGTGNGSDNLIIGNAANNTLNGAAGNDILQGGAGIDTITDTVDNNLLDGGAGADIITGGIGKDFIIGGTGNDTITTGTGADVIAFNMGDGADIVNASTGKDNTLSLGHGIKYADLLFKKSTNDLVLVTGSGEQVTFKDWYLNTTNHSVANLQIVIEGTTDYNAASSNQLNNKKIEQFNFDGLVTAFDTARAANSSLTSWALSSSLLSFYLSGSDTAAIGGDLAYQYAKNGNLSNMSLTPAQALLAGASFGIASQNLQLTGNLQDQSPRLM